MHIVMTLETAQHWFMLALLALLALRASFALRRWRTIQQHNRQASVLQYGAICGTQLLPALLIIWPVLDVFNWAFNPLLALAGAVIMVISLWIYACSYVDLGENWSPSLALHTKHRLVQTGVYQHFRHPMYCATWLWCIAQAMLLQNWLSGLSGIASFALLYFSWVRKEERLLLRHFGADYLHYMQKTGRVLPKWQ